jgi:2-polyprenyl-3-methyl-5-hydroxy-6-metoxy-1,4-benzoquinol methylase
MTSPARWLTDHAQLLPRAGRALDVACGSGRHALWLAERGFSTTALDRDDALVHELHAEAARRGLEVHADVVDLEHEAFALDRSSFDVIVVVHYLHRPLFNGLLAALRPGGVLVYETFTRAQAQRGRPTNPAYLLEPGELLRRVDGLDVLASREGEFEGRMVASVVARRPAP